MITPLSVPVKEPVPKAQLEKAKLPAKRQPVKLIAGATRATKQRRPTVARPGTKTAKILKLLERPGGASLNELTKATKWQAHSVRGFLSGAVKGKMRLKLTTLKRDDGERAYRVSTK